MTFQHLSYLPLFKSTLPLYHLYSLPPLFLLPPTFLSPLSPSLSQPGPLYLYAEETVIVSVCMISEPFLIFFIEKRKGETAHVADSRERG